MNRRLKPQPESSTQEVLAGLVERVTFHNAENGFCVIRIKAQGNRELVTAVGHAATIAAGEWVTAPGEWVNDRTHGQQFRSCFPRTSAPTTIEGIEKYLGSGMIRGIGTVYARKMVKWRSARKCSRDRGGARPPVRGDRYHPPCAPRGCISFGGMRIDRAVGAEVIERLQPLGIEAAIGAMEARRGPYSPTK